MVNVAVVPKPAGGERPISLPASSVRLWERCRKTHLTDWRSERACFWDYAVRASSALRSVLTANIADETARTMGAEAATMCWDIDKFYDSIDLERYLAIGKSQQRRSSEYKVFGYVAQSPRLKLCQRISLPDNLKAIFRCPAHEDSLAKLGGSAADCAACPGREGLRNRKRSRRR